MANFDVSKNWVILLPANKTHMEKAAEDLARYIGLLASLNGAEAPKPPPLLDAHDSTLEETVPVIILNHEDRDLAHNGFSWRAMPDRVEILGDSSQGLCKGIYSFLAALGISWPAPGEEILPPPPAKTPKGKAQGKAQGFPLSASKAHVPSD